MKKRLIALFTSIALLAMLCVDVRTMSTTHDSGSQTARLGLPNHAGRLEASVPSKTWESPPLHQSARNKATLATITSPYRKANAATLAFAATVTFSGPHSAQLTRPISPRAPPRLSISL